MTVEDDFAHFKDVEIPVRRAAYSDRTAWIMATMAELAYKDFGPDEENNILSLAGELATLANQKEIAERLKALRVSFRKPRNDKDQILKAVLSAGGFKLAGKGILYNKDTDTQGFVAVKAAGDEPGMAVICFRGTKETKDWLTNLDAEPIPIRSTKPDSDEILGMMHHGFHEAYKSVEGQIKANLEGHEDLPLFITGHSLGGALAVIATWYQNSENLAACYTFGAPRVGSIGLIDRFKTPIYRVVNGSDPVPFAPPSSEVVEFIQTLFELLAKFAPIVGGVATWLGRFQGYTHYGFMRYLSMVSKGEDGDYPDLRVEYSLSSFGRAFRYYKRILTGQGNRIDKYHNMDRYRDKLRAHADRRNKK
ncbi:MAG: lipase family protein [Alphaproteobacteria bacterium]|nr:lipase family protein [Alphaproteobacteria bacterium]